MALLTIVELARCQGISRNNVRELIADGLATHKGPDNQVLIDVDEYEDYVADLEDEEDDEDE